MLVTLARAISVEPFTEKSVFLQADIGVHTAGRKVETAKGRNGEETEDLRSPTRIDATDNSSYRTLRDGFHFSVYPRHFMPGYLHSVPPGQLPCVKVRQVEQEPASRSFRSSVSSTREIKDHRHRRSTKLTVSELPRWRSSLEESRKSLYGSMSRV